MSFAEGFPEFEPNSLGMPFQAIWEDESHSRTEVESLGGSTLLEFGAEWCPHCQAVQPLLEERLRDSAVRHLKVSDGKGKRLGREFQVKLWPNFVLLKDGEVVSQLARPGQAELAQLLDSALAG